MAEKDFGETLAELIGDTPKVAFDHDQDSRESDLVAFIRIKMEKGYNDPFPQGDLITYLECARWALGSFEVNGLGDLIDISDEECTRLLDQLNAELNPKDRLIDQIPCIQITAKDWIERADVQEWLHKPENCVPRLWCDDFFIVYDNGEGPHSPTGGEESAMPLWLWNKIEEIMKDKGLKYAIVRLMNYEA